MKDLEVHHLSHIDLDGYGCQFIAKYCFPNIHFYNANYGKEVKTRLNEILDSIKRAEKSGFLILITDLNLTLKEAKFLQNEVNLLNGVSKKIKLMLLDHHITGAECANEFEWYFLDDKISASKITFNHFKDELKPEDSAWLAPFSDMINAADTWVESSPYFPFGKVAMGMIAQSREFSRFMFDSFDREFKFSMLNEAKNYLLDSNNQLKTNADVELDNNIFLFKKRLLDGDYKTQTMDNILSLKQCALLSENKEKYSITHGDKKGLLTYAIGGISVLANLFLANNSEFDFFVDVGMRGNVSLRSNGKCDVSAISKEFFNGGGHKNASGGKIEGFKESFLYEDIKIQFEDVLNGLSYDDDDIFAL